MNRDREIAELKEKDKKKQDRVVPDYLEMDLLKGKLEETNLQNAQLLLQRKNLSKAKDSIQQELSQTLTKLESL